MCYQVHVIKILGLKALLLFIDSLADSDWIEWNGGPGKYCLINVDCSIKLVLRDKNRNIVEIPYVLTNNDVDIVMIGTQETLYIRNIDNTESGQGIYYIKYKRYMVGEYQLFIRLREVKAPIYPFSITVYTETIEPGRT
jgi:hypothetical protein